MTKYYEETTTRKYIKEWMDAWVEAEKQLGLKNNLFLIKDGMVTQYCDGGEGEDFYEFVKAMSEEEFDIVCEDFWKAIEKDDLVKMFKALAIFDEMDNHSLGTDYMKRRLMRVRKATHHLSFRGPKK